MGVLWLFGATLKGHALGASRAILCESRCSILTYGAGFKLVNDDRFLHNVE